MELRQRGLAYCQAVQDLSGGVAPFLYSYPNYWQELQGASEPRFAAFNLWQASYSVPTQSWPIDGQSPNVLRPWTSWAFWQFTDRGKLPGGGGVDLDVFWGGETDLQALRLKPEGKLEGTPEFVVPDPTPT
jgi:GH25 family lysozyme M1 (1,4-beta-N-acetylmuramidase)